MQYRWAAGLVVVSCVLACAGPEPSGPAEQMTITDDDGTVLAQLELGIAAVGSHRAARVHVRNTGDTPLAALAVEVTPAVFHIRAEGTTCIGVAIEPGRDCIVIVEYAPDAVGSHTGELTVRAGNSLTADLPLVGTGAQPVLSVVPAIPDLGLVPINTVAYTAVHVTNIGVIAAPLDSIAVDQPAFRINGVTCGTTLAIGASCDISLAFMPTTFDVDSAMVTVTTSGIPHTGLITGQGLGSSLRFDPPSIDLSDLPVSVPVSVVVHLINDGNLVAPISKYAGQFPLTATTCGASLAGGASCDLTLTFLDDSAGDLAEDFIVMSDGVLHSLPWHISVVLPPLGLYFPSVPSLYTTEINTTQIRGAVIQNDGSVPALIGSATTDSPVFSIISGCEGVTIPAGGQCTISVGFTPTVFAEQIAHVYVATSQGVRGTQVRGSGGRRITIEHDDRGVVDTVGADPHYCGSDCTFVVSGIVTLEAWPQPGYTFAGWTEPGCTSNCADTTCLTYQCSIPRAPEPRVLRARYVP